MNKEELRRLWAESLGSPTSDGLDRLAQAVVDLYASGDTGFRQHIKNRFSRVAKSTGQELDPDNFDIAMARAFIADEIGFESWDKLIEEIKSRGDGRPILFHYAIAAMWRGDFTGLVEAIGRDRFCEQIVEWYENGRFDSELETLNEILSAACMLGQTRTAEYLIEKGVDSYAGMRSWLAGPHYAVSSGRLDTVRMLLDKKIPLEVENKYGGTMLGQALWSAINEHMDTHAEIIERLIDAGAKVEPGTDEWWEQQPVPSSETKERVARALRRRSRTETV